jgi:hypothetical protein
MSPQHTTQLNDYTSSASMDAFLGHPFRWKAPVPFNVHPRSENQLVEGTLAGLMQNSISIVARKAFIDLLDRYRTTGHQGKEFATPSHSPHWYRPMSVALWWGIEHQITQADVLNSVIRWWCYDAWVRDQYRVPHGPLAGQIIGWGARDNGFKGHNDIRDIIDALLISNGSRNSLNKKQFHILSNAEHNADTFGAFVIQILLTKHSDILSQIKPEKPVIAYDLDIVRTSDALTCTCHDPDPKDSHIVNVDYSAGKVTVS